LAQDKRDILDIIGKMQFRIALAGGWIDQPFMSKHDPNPPGSMVVAAVEPQFWWMDRAGICSSTRIIAKKLWGDKFPNEDKEKLVRTLYYEENKDRIDPSGSQDMIGLIYPGINRLDYDYNVNGGIFPKHVESNNDPQIAAWLSSVLYILPVNMRPDNYSPLGRKNLDPAWVRKLGQCGKDCFDAILNMDVKGLGQAMTNCMNSWRVLLPDNFDHPRLHPDTNALLDYYQRTYCGAAYSGCGGGYLYVASDKPVPGGFQVTIKVEQ
jgi:hypothetical protein